MQPEPLVRPFPIFATWTGRPFCQITFSETLSPGPFDPDNWFARWQNLSYEITHANISALPFSQHVRLIKGPTQISVGPNILAWNPPPFDMRSFTTGNHVLRFNNFPINP